MTEKDEKPNILLSCGQTKNGKCSKSGIEPSICCECHVEALNLADTHCEERIKGIKEHFRTSDGIGRLIGKNDDLRDEITRLKADLDSTRAKVEKLKKGYVVERVKDGKLEIIECSRCQRIHNLLGKDIDSIIAGIEPAKKQIGPGQIWRIFNEIQKDLEALKSAECLKESK